MKQRKHALAIFFAEITKTCFLLVRFIKNYGYCCANSKVAFDGKLGVADGTDVLHYGKTESGTADTF